MPLRDLFRRARGKWICLLRDVCGRDCLLRILVARGTTLFLLSLSSSLASYAFAFFHA